eukprot:3600272-Amphidinium_carterae.1
MQFSCVGKRRSRALGFSTALTPFPRGLCWRVRAGYCRVVGRKAAGTLVGIAEVHWARSILPGTLSPIECDT